MSNKAIKKENTVLEAKEVRKYYKQRKKITLSNKKVIKNPQVRAVDGVDFLLNKGEILGIIGESGCGKSTLGRVLVGLESPTGGKVLLNGEDIQKSLKNNRLNVRRKIQIIFQNPFDTFDPRFSIRKILGDTLKLHNIETNKKELEKIITEKIENVGLKPAESFLNRFPHELSGGQLQRISIVRAMMLNPSVVVADEPVSMLDVSIRAEIINLLHSLAKEQNISVVFISHDISTTRYISDRIAVMYLGQIVEMVDTKSILTNSKHSYTKALISNCASIDPRKKLNPIKLKGEPATPIIKQEGCLFKSRCQRATLECSETKQVLVKQKDGNLVRCMRI